MAKKKTGLGRGLDALFADAAPVNEEEYIKEETLDKIKRASSDEKEERTDVHIITDSKNDTSDEDRVIYVDINEAES